MEIHKQKKKTTPHLPECRGLGIYDYLIKPLQRICKYPLFLRVKNRVLVVTHFLKTVITGINEIYTS